VDRPTCYAALTTILSPKQDTCRRRQGIQVDTTCIRATVHVSGVNAALEYLTRDRICPTSNFMATPVDWRELTFYTEPQTKLHEYVIA